MIKTPTPETESSTWHAYIWDSARLKYKPAGRVVPIGVSKKLERQRDELLEVLEEVTNKYLWRSDSEFPLSKEESQRLYDIAVTAIANVRGGGE